jgi:RNA polymerase sigma-70 factor (ECF subfamily)
VYVAPSHRLVSLEATETALNIRSLFERHYPSLVWFLHGRLGDRDLAEDLAQEAFVRLIEKPPRAPESWLYVVAGNLARDAQRGELRRSRHLAVVRAQSDSESETVDPIPGADAAMCKAEESELVRETLALLPERDAALLVMRADNVSYREIAAAIGVSPTSVGPLLARAQQRFIRALGSRVDISEKGSDARASG